MTTIENPVTADEVVELEAYANWTAADVTDRSDWTLRLSADDHAELDVALELYSPRRELGFRLLHNLHRLLQLAHTRDHREHDPDVAKLCRA